MKPQIYTDKHSFLSQTKIKTDFEIGFWNHLNLSVSICLNLWLENSYFRALRASVRGKK